MANNREIYLLRMDIHNRKENLAELSKVFKRCKARSLDIAMQMALGIARRKISISEYGLDDFLDPVDYKNIRLYMRSKADVKKAKDGVKK